MCCLLYCLGIIVTHEYIRETCISHEMSYKVIVLAEIQNKPTTKILEKIICRIVVQHLDKNALLNKTQHGFLPQRS